MPFLVQDPSHIFDFTLKNPWALFSFIALIIYILLAYIVLRRGLDDAVSRMFAFLAGVISIWAFSEFLLRMSKYPEGASFWMDWGALGWIPMSVIFFTFVLMFLGRTKVLENLIFQILLYGPCFIFLFFAWNTDLLVRREFVAKFWGWHTPMGDFFPVFLLWLETFFILSLFLLVRFYFKTKIPEKKDPAIVIAIAIFIPLLIGSITDAIFPLFNVEVPGMAVFVNSITYMLVVFIILRRRLSIISPAAASSAIIDTMNEALLVFSVRGIIELANKASLQLLGYPEKELVGRSIKNIIPQGKAWQVFSEEGLARVAKGGQIKNFETRFLMKNQQEIPVSFSVSPIRSPSREVIAIVAVANDIGETKKIIKKLEETTEELRSAKYQLERKLGERIGI